MAPDSLPPGPYRKLPEKLRKKFESRRGQKPSDIPLSKFLGEIGYTNAADPKRPDSKPGTPPAPGPT